MSVYVNRILNMKSIKAIGFDMDHTLVRYKTKNFEELTYYEVVKKLISVKEYPAIIKELEFDFDAVSVGLVIDKKVGSLLKVSRFGKVKEAFLGTQRMDFKIQQKIYRNRSINLSYDRFQSLDTPFSIANGSLFMQLMDLKQQGIPLPDPYVIADDLLEVIDMAHADNTLKSEVEKNVSKYITETPNLAPLLEKYKQYGKKLLVITNSEFHYTKLLMDYIITPHLKDHKDWGELFDITVTISRKPTFFTNSNPFLKIDPKTGLMSNHIGKIENGIYQGGWAGKLESDLGLNGDQILYIGDHIFGDVLSLKKTFNWRTAFVQAALEKDIQGHQKSTNVQDQIDEYMNEKENLEEKQNELEALKIEKKNTFSKEEYKIESAKVHSKIDDLNKKISPLIADYKTYFNKNFGEIMRAGIDESHFASQVEEYACIYMAHVTDFLENSPIKYYRPSKRVLPHEMDTKFKKWT